MYESNWPNAIAIGQLTQIAIAAYQFIQIMTHLVNASILGPAITDADVTLEDLALGLLEEEGIEVVLDGGKVGARSVADGGEKDGLLGIALGDDARIAGGEGVVPKGEEGTNLGLGNVLGSAGGGVGAELDLAKGALLGTLAAAAVEGGGGFLEGEGGGGVDGGGEAGGGGGLDANGECTGGAGGGEEDGEGRDLHGRIFMSGSGSRNTDVGKLWLQSGCKRRGTVG